MSRVKQSLKIKKLETGYFPLTDDPLELRKLLTRALTHESKTLLSLIEAKEGARTNFTTRLVGYSPSENFVEFALNLELKKGKARLKPVEAMAVIFLKGSNLLCMQSTQLAWDKDSLILKAPWRVLKFQRRRELRLEIPRGYEYFAELPLSRTLTHKFRILDISAQGMSVQTLSPRESTLLPKGCLVPKLSFTLDGVKVVTGARVASHSPIAGRRGLRIGLEFMRMGEESSHVLSAFVTRFLSQYYLDD
jgi:c-di-GMP-binding flagellar brake protein YcgR